MDFSQFSYGELMKLHYQLQFEMFKRTWAIILIIILIAIIGKYLYDKLF